jgi:hypothetical protein
MIGNGPALPKHRSYQQIFGPSIRRALKDIQFLLSQGCCRHRQGRLSNSRHTNQSGRKRKILLVHHQPTGKQLMQHLFLADPIRTIGHWGGQLKLNTLYFDCILTHIDFAYPLCSLGSFE